MKETLLVLTSRGDQAESMTTDLAAGPDPATPAVPAGTEVPAEPAPPATATASGRRWLPLAAAGVTMVLWASAFVVIRALSGAVAPGPLALGRLLVGSLVLTAVALLRPGRGRLAIPRGRPLLLIIAYGVLWFGVYTVAVNAAGRYLDAGTSAMLVNLAPVVVAVLAGIFLGEGFPRQLMLGLLIAFAAW